MQWKLLLLFLRGNRMSIFCVIHGLVFIVVNVLCNRDQA